jgi:hypothetical protein
MRSSVRGFTVAGAVNARETVDFDTPAAFATSRLVDTHTPVMGTFPFCPQKKARSDAGLMDIYGRNPKYPPVIKSIAREF